MNKNVAIPMPKASALVKSRLLCCILEQISRVTVFPSNAKQQMPKKQGSPSGWNDSKVLSNDGDQIFPIVLNHTVPIAMTMLVSATIYKQLMCFIERKKQATGVSNPISKASAILWLLSLGSTDSIQTRKNRMQPTPVIAWLRKQIDATNQYPLVPKHAQPKSLKVRTLLAPKNFWASTSVQHEKKDSTAFTVIRANASQ